MISRDQTETTDGRPVVIASLLADTRDTERKLGLRGSGVTERRLLFRSEHAYLEMRVPAEPPRDEAGAWLYAQVVPAEPDAGTFEPPLVAVLRAESGYTGAVRATETGEFAIPYGAVASGEKMVVDIEPTVGAIFRATFQA